MSIRPSTCRITLAAGLLALFGYNSSQSNEPANHIYARPKLDFSVAISWPHHEVQVLSINSPQVCKPKNSECDALICDNSLPFCWRVRELSSNEWELEIRSNFGAGKIDEIVFPSKMGERFLEKDSSVDAFLFPYIAGTRENAKARAQVDRMLYRTYPGGLFSPYVILMNDAEAIIWYASNWPPKAVRVAYGASQTRFSYKGDGGTTTDWPAWLHEVPLNGQSKTYRFTEKRIKRRYDESGAEPWVEAISSYHTWLAERWKPEPISSDYTNEMQGFISYQLQNRKGKINGEISELISNWSSDFPWILVWGQMSQYGEDCCALSQKASTFNSPRIEFIRESIKNANGKFGFYAAPPYRSLSDADSSATGKHGWQWISDWLNYNEETLHANVFYIDTLGRLPWDSPTRLCELFQSTMNCLNMTGRPFTSASPHKGKRLPKNTIIEGAIDLYPTISILDGGVGIGSNAPLNHPLDKEPETISAFPELAAIGLPNHSLHFGGLNGDWKFTGSRGNYKTEITAFLLGARLTGSNLIEKTADGKSINNSVASEIVEIRKSSQFLQRKLKYLHTTGLTKVPKQIKARVFVDSFGKKFVVSVNKTPDQSLSITIDGSPVSACKSKLSILDIVARTCYVASNR